MSKKNTFYFILVVMTVFLTCLSLPSKVKGHPPDGVDLSYNINTQMLNVSIAHEVLDNTTHFIETVIIRVNGSTVLTTPPYTSQPSIHGALYQYAIVANPGARISVLVHCNQVGSLSACIVVGGGACGGNGGIPGYLGLWLIIGVSLTISFTLIYKKIKH
jgi:hypothetical protein